MPRPPRDRPPLTPQQRQLAESLFPTAKRYARWAMRSYPFLDADEVQSRIYLATCIAVATHRSDRGASLGTHLFNCCRNAVLGMIRIHHRVHGRFCQHESALAVAAAPAKTSKGPDFRPLHAGMARLSERDRHVLIERFWKKRLHGEIAADMGLSRQRIQQQQRNALDRLRDKIDHDAAFG